ncbi:hypothetical protein FRACYDRAFT_244750 [Fragilariopsis cylindrus CCMP1102]|uniref:F-box domain-containing protein n=1 Tax=Fragilariopsis cylindrus CCMP1102 TaxID=635003 RepID=A0A1E7F0A2_9STRA|nr:hypothetical protein FRACYDRAFT_244750 [Fragilariopsis cylindrus CCMP1102]|eukprot:OEU11632.1 hypothetical protein FRACYDRAFT_244750 [Fragilariopsis cylindrus CCMP1102]
MAVPQLRSSSKRSFGGETLSSKSVEHVIHEEEVVEEEEDEIHKRKQVFKSCFGDNELRETQDGLITLTLVSKQVYNKDRKQPGIEWKIVPTIEIRPRQQGGSTLALLQQLCNHHNILRYPHTHMRVYDVHKITRSSGQIENAIIRSIGRSQPEDATKQQRNIDELQDEGRAMADITKSCPFDSILSLDMSYSKPMVVPMILPNILIKILPNLREINLSHICTSTDVLYNVSNQCPYLEKVTWNNIRYYTNDACVGMSGWDMRTAKNLKEIIMDNSEFQFDLDIIRKDRFLFYCCSNALERVSISNATRYILNNPLPQSVLINFVRNVPTLRWFRSDLTEESKNMLRLERPDIEFLN